MIKLVKKLDLKFVFMARFLEKTIWKSLPENYALLVKKKTINIRVAKNPVY